MKKVSMRSILLAGVFVLVAVGMYYFISNNMLPNTKASLSLRETKIEQYYKTLCQSNLPAQRADGSTYSLYCGPKKRVLGNELCLYDGVGDKNDGRGTLIRCDILNRNDANFYILVECKKCLAKAIGMVR